jgi:hypothetical protein
LLGDGGAEPVVVGDEAADELVQAALENLVHPAVLQPGADAARLALRGTLAAVSARDVVEIAGQILATARQRPRHLLVEDQQVGDQPGFEAFAVDPMVDRERRADRARWCGRAPDIPGRPRWSLQGGLAASLVTFLI